MARMIDWQVIQTSASGLAPQGLMDPIQCFRVARIEHTVLVDLSGLRLDTSKPGLCNLGHLPVWAAAAIPQQYHWINDHASSLHASRAAVHVGRTLYWVGQEKDGQIDMRRPETLRGGFEFTTMAPWPKELTT